MIRTRREAARTAVQHEEVKMAPASATPPGAATHPASLLPAVAGTIPFRRLVSAALLCGAALSVPTLSGEVRAGDRFVVERSSAAGRARWVGVDGDLVALGSGNLALLVRGEGADSAVVSRLELDREVEQAVLAGDRLWVAGPETGLWVVALGRAEARSAPVPLEPPVQGALHLARSDDHLFVAEDGLGLRIVRLPGHRAVPGHEGHHDSVGIVEDGLLEIDASFTSVAASGPRAWLALPGGSVLVVDVADRTSPRIERTLELGFEIADLAANGDTLDALGTDGALRVLRPDAGGSYEVVDRLDVAGASELDLAGRTIRFAGGVDGLITAHDTSSTAANVTVSVGDTFFSPSSVTINVGDTVTWSKPVTGLSHNVESCDGASDPSFCLGEVAADGLFRSGNVTTAAFNFSHVFNNAGGNPYFCALHGFSGMTGRVNVNGVTAPPPPPVPDGKAVLGTEMKANRLDQAGSSISVAWDATTCTGAVNYHIVYGSQFPAAPGGTYQPAGGSCAIGTVSPVTWTNVPALAPNQLLWWVVVADDGAGTEGSWGAGTAGERAGPGAGGSSGQCAITAKDLTDTCGL